MPRKPYKYKNGWIDEFLTLTNRDGKLDWRFSLNNDYSYQCLRYIHENPVKAKLVSKSTEWVFSSAQDYAGLRSGSLCNVDLGRKIMRFK